MRLSSISLSGDSKLLKSQSLFFFNGDMAGHAGTSSDGLKRLVVPGMALGSGAMAATVSAAAGSYDQQKTSERTKVCCWWFAAASRETPSGARYRREGHPLHAIKSKGVSVRVCKRLAWRSPVRSAWLAV